MPGTIWGALNLNDDDERYVNTIGQQTVWDAVQQVLNDFNAELALARGIFVAETTKLYREIYKLPGGGYLQSLTNIGQPGARKVEGEQQVEYPLFSWGDQIAGNDVELAYMTLPELQRHLDAVQTRAKNTMRKEILKTIFPNTSWSVKDQTNAGDLTVKPLANGDSDLYSPLPGTESLITENHYLESGYAASAIDDTNNPVTTITDELEEHFGGGAIGGRDVVVFFNKAQRSKLKLLPDFANDGLDEHLAPGSNVTTVVGLPQGLPGKVIGTAGAWLVEWDYIPENYLFGLHLSAPKPLKMRVDSAPGLGEGNLVLVQKDKSFPLESSFYRQRYGFGVANRLNGVVMELGTGGTYSTPVGYSR
ncbi:MAG: hypothetical protein IPL32_18125 [Chloracidobacterium sp.]|nr:hypothetical protein [Chloracidobacterium sp.]